MKFDKLVKEYMGRLDGERSTIAEEAMDGVKYLKTQGGDFVCAGDCWEKYVKATGKGTTDGQPKDQIKDYMEVNAKYKTMPKDYKCKICGIMPARESMMSGSKFDVDGFKALAFEMEGGDHVCSGDCFEKYCKAKGEATAGKPEDTLEMYKKINSKFKVFPKGFKCGVCGKTPEKVDITGKKAG